MRKLIKILAGYTLVFSFYIIIANFLVIERDVRITPERFLLAIVTILPVIVFAILVLIYSKKKDN